MKAMARRRQNGLKRMRRPTKKTRRKNKMKVMMERKLRRAG